MDEFALQEVRDDVDRRAAAERVLADVPGWYHTIDLGGGITTPGLTDVRPFVPKVLPRDLAGRRCLDIGTFDGAYAFGMEERGAASVVAIDVPDASLIDYPPLHRARNEQITRDTRIQPGDGFRAAAAARRSRATWIPCNVYDLSPDVIGGQVDFAVVGTLLQHLRDPVRALERVRDALRPGGRAVLAESIDWRLSLQHPRRPVMDFRAANPTSRYTWFVPTLAGLRAWPAAAGLEVVRGAPRTYSLRSERVASPRHRLAVVTVRRPH